ncbi:MAG: carbohydrate kinase family protein [Eubacteriales bacterium]|nr:carbohydrate kinase family protein [Eubacteriales bacterium]
MAKKYDVVCIGDATLDITMCNIPSNFLCADSSYADIIAISVGGDAANQAAVSSALGNSTALVAKIGDDDIGRIIQSKLRNEKIDLDYTLFSAEKGSGFCVVIVQPNGQRNFLVWAGSGKKDLSLPEMNLDFLDQTRAVCVGSLFCLKELDRGGIAAIFQQARRKGVLTFADMTADAYHIGGAAFQDLYPHVDYLLPSLAEARYVTGESDPRAMARRLMREGVRNVVIKLGDEGCYVKSPDEEFFLDPYAIDALDTTGCGDNFTAGFLYGVLHGYSLRDSASFGCAAGAINATKIGAHGAVESCQQVLDFQKTVMTRSIRR